MLNLLKKIDIDIAFPVACIYLIASTFFGSFQNGGEFSFGIDLGFGLFFFVAVAVFVVAPIMLVHAFVSKKYTAQ